MNKSEEGQFLFFVAPIVGAIYGTYRICDLFSYTNDSLANRLFNAVFFPIGYAIFLFMATLFIGSLVESLKEKYKLTTIVIATFVICIGISILFSFGESKYLSRYKAITTAYDAGYYDAIENEGYNDDYFNEFEDTYYFKGGY